MTPPFAGRAPWREVGSAPGVPTTKTVEFVYYARMSPLAPFRKWTLSAGIAIALVLTLPLVGLPSVAHADLGDSPSSKSSSDGVGQTDDADKPKDSSLLERKPADAAVEQQKQAPVGPAFYEKWQFWVIAGAVVVGAIALVIGGQALYHTINGGDVRPCNVDFQGRCFGEGR
jgi:hypothetical protein